MPYVLCLFEMVSALPIELSTIGTCKKNLNYRIFFIISYYALLKFHNLLLKKL